MNYIQAKVYDKRGFCKNYWEFLKGQVLILIPFFNITPIEPFYIRILNCFLNLSLYFVFNALFFDDDYISKRFTNKIDAAYFFKNEMPKCIYAGLVSVVLGILLSFLSSTKRQFRDVINNEKDPNQFLIRTRKIVRCVRIKMVVYCVLDLVLIGAFWYYISAFCAVYLKTQTAWLEGTLVTVVICLILQSFFAFILALFRYLGLKCKIPCLYKVASFCL